MSENYFPARWWTPLDDQKVECHLCPRNCIITSGHSGFCKVRGNLDGKLFSLAYGHPVALQNDPIEKKPLAEFMSGTRTFSLGTFGCNLDCRFCQNHHLSRGDYSSGNQPKFVPPETIVEMAIKNNCQSIACTYNEPTIFAEYVIDIAQVAAEKELAMVLVTNGYITLEAAKDLYPLIDAANIDMKGFSDDFYRDLTGSNLHSVLDAIEFFYSLGKHLEITNLIIPDQNDSLEMIDKYLDWVEEKLDQQVPLHFSAYHPDYQYFESQRTEAKILHSIRDHAQQRGFTSIYLGNIL